MNFFKKHQGKLVPIGIIVFFGLWISGIYAIPEGDLSVRIPKALLNAFYAFEGHDEIASNIENGADFIPFVWNFLFAAIALIITSIAILSLFEDFVSKVKLYWRNRKWLRLNSKKPAFFFLEFDEENELDAEALIKNSLSNDKNNYNFLYTTKLDFQPDLKNLKENQSKALKKILRFRDATVSERDYIAKVNFSSHYVTVTNADNTDSLRYSKASLATKNMMEKLKEYKLYEKILKEHKQPKILIVGSFDNLFEEIFTQLCIFLQNPNTLVNGSQPQFILVIDDKESRLEQYFKMMFPALRDLGLVSYDFKKHITELSQQEISDCNVAFVGNLPELEQRASLNYILQARKKAKNEIPIVFNYDDKDLDIFKEIEVGAYINLGDVTELFKPEIILHDILDETPRMIDWLYGDGTRQLSQYSSKEKELEIRKWNGKIVEGEQGNKESEIHNLSEFDKASNRAVANFIDNYNVLRNEDFVKYYEEKISNQNPYEPEKENRYVAMTEHLRWNTFHAINGYTKMSEKTFRDRYDNYDEKYKAHDEQNIGKFKTARQDYQTLQHICLVPWEELDDVSTFVNKKGENKDFKSLDFTIISIAKELYNENLMR